MSDYCFSDYCFEEMITKTFDNVKSYNESFFAKVESDTFVPCFSFLTNEDMKDIKNFSSTTMTIVEVERFQVTKHVVKYMSCISKSTGNRLFYTFDIKRYDIDIKTGKIIEERTINNSSIENFEDKILDFMIKLDCMIKVERRRKNGIFEFEAISPINNFYKKRKMRKIALKYLERNESYEGK